MPPLRNRQPSHIAFAGLTAEGHKRALANAFEIAKKEIPDLVISDHQMPGGSGIDLCKWLKSTPSTESIPAILLTAYDFSIVEEEMGDCNVCAIMAKPFSPRELLAKANAIMGIPAPS